MPQGGMKTKRICRKGQKRYSRGEECPKAAWAKHLVSRVDDWLRRKTRAFPTCSPPNLLTSSRPPAGPFGGKRVMPQGGMRVFQCVIYEQHTMW